MIKRKFDSYITRAGDARGIPGGWNVGMPYSSRPVVTFVSWVKTCSVVLRESFYKIRKTHIINIPNVFVHNVLESRFVNQVMLIIKRSIDIVLFILQRNIFLQTWTGWTAFSVHTHLVVTIESGTYHLMTENVPILKYNIGLIFNCFCKCTQQNWNYILCFNSQCFQCFCYIYVRMFFSYQWCT